MAALIRWIVKFQRFLARKARLRTRTLGKGSRQASSNLSATNDGGEGQFRSGLNGELCGTKFAGSKHVVATDGLHSALGPETIDQSTNDTQLRQ